MSRTKSLEPTEIEKLRAQINSERGEGRFHLANALPNTKYIPTGIFLLDYALLGGVPDGRASLVYGVEGSGKSTLLYRTITEFQKKYPDKIAVLADVEQMFDPYWGEMIGMDLNRVEILQPDHGQEAADMVIAYMDTWEVGFVCIDSLASLIPKQLDERSTEDYGVGERAKIIGEFCSKAINSWSRERRRDHNVTVFNVNQYRDKMNASKYEDPRKLPGGWQSRYFPKVKVQMKQRKIFKKGNPNPDHNLNTFAIQKEKGATLQSGEFKVNLNPDHPLGVGVGEIDDFLTVATYAKAAGFITGGGASWYVDGNETKFRKRDEIIAHLAANRPEYQGLKRKIMMAKRIELGMEALPPDDYLLASE